ncbi:MAG: 2-dehydropantoate 2-reductase N-terminal domain-containing protein, partial [Fervidobacterium sp.]
MKIAIAGAGYVGFSLGVMLSQYHEVVMYDIDQKRVELINIKRSPIIDKDIQIYLREKKLNISATTKPEEAFTNANYIIVATSADFNPAIGQLDTTSIEDVVSKSLRINPD